MDKGFMAPTRKPRTMNKWPSSLNEVSPEKDGINLNKNKQRKKILSDKLGPQWNKAELERFYEAYRKYGKDWKKVAAVVRNRSVEMVEALYNMNRAYLSLPEGTASVVGLIAMMTDHYNVLEESDSERDSNDAPGSRKPVKRKRGRVQLSVSKDSIQSRSIASDDGCLSLLKRRRTDGSQPRAVGKRTPRIPVYYSNKIDDGENYILPNKRNLKSAFDNTDDEVAHVAALALTEAAHRGGSPQISQTPYTRSQQKSSPVQSWERMHQQSKTVPTKFYDASMDEEFIEGSIESRGAENGECARDTSSLMDLGSIATVEVNQKWENKYRKKGSVENVGNHFLDDGGEACSGTEGLNLSLKGKVDIEVTNAKPEKFSEKGQRKRNKKLLFEDEGSALDALQTLADLSLMIPPSTMESDSPVQMKDERMYADKDEESVLPEATSTSQNRDGIKLPGQKAVRAVPGVEVSTSKKSKLGKESENDMQLPSADRTCKKKGKSMVSKVANAKPDSYPTGHLNNEDGDEENKPMIKGKCTDQTFTKAKQLKSVRSTESPLCSDPKDLAASAAEVPLASEGILPTKKKSRRKASLPRAFMAKEKCSENILTSQPINYSTPIQDKALFLKEKLSSCLSSYMFRRWCTFEWFYSAIDYPWFSKQEFMEYLNHVGLGNIPRLTRLEWSVIKSSLGKPRRFSEHFLREERQKLEQYRESVRKHYTELRTGIRDGLPTDLAKPLYVGQLVIALHPKTREIHDGSVLTVDHDKCRVQFDRPELGVEFVRDIDCMPLNPLENMPEALRWQIGAGNIPFMSKEPQMKGNSSFGGCLPYDSSGPVEKQPASSISLTKQGMGGANNSVSQANAAITNYLCTQPAVSAQPCTMTDHQTKEADIHALSEFTRALDKKEKLVMELKVANDDMLENQNGVECFRDSEAFKKHYGMVLLQLKEASGQVSNALLQLRQHNSYIGNYLPPWMKPPVSFDVLDGLPSASALDSSLAQELGSTGIDIIKGSRLKAHAMVDAAFQALSSMKESEDGFMKIGKTLDSINHQPLATNSRLPVFRSQEQVNGSLSGPLPNDDAPGPKLHHDSVKVDTQIPSELITSCVATLIMIQNCTERQYPPADVAQIIDSAVTSLHPCCPQNLPIYREIQMCMGRIKTQILALIPT
ncbi:PREDICTED: protein ALWAYS EARLY 2 isoform X1 [Lupinus angustifolius]|uniref:protein ALWAYS EARLY 2 isoform X1 n=1 Tax=Lupinus angustifolius TaxID=3871 RepID=UPI00092F25D4|nr:PREDICTED: protein ALWAYS EARLY 2 isoform X1 [Lupinus angustifolius]